MTRILFVDDEVAMRRLVQEALSLKGYEVVTAPLADQALSVITDQPLDLILLDVQLPGESGISILKKIRQLNAEVPIVIYSGAVTAEIEKEARAAGANEVLGKDIGVMQLAERIGKIVQAKRRFPEGDPGREGRTVLIVDDDSGIRHLLDEFLRSKGYRTLQAENGERGVELARAEKPTVVLLDVAMPGMDGLATLKRIRENDPHMGVVMATAHHDDKLVRQAMELGAYGYVLKPFDLLYLELVLLSKLSLAANS